MTSYDIIDWKHVGAETEIWDVRSPSEFAEDHIPCARNVPVLSDEERAEVGSLYRRDPFQARKLGAAYIAENVANLLRGTLRHQDGGLHPLVYCWRGGLRSQSIATILSHVGWRVHLLAGGYKAFRQVVRTELESLPGQLQFCILAGPTGAGKTALLQKLESLGHQSLDLEGLAKHRGSLLGALPETPQPHQKQFESLLHHKLCSFAPDKPVWVEAESHRVGAVHIPDHLFKAMRRAPIIELDVPRGERVEHLIENYNAWVNSPDLLIEKLRYLTRLRSKATVESWIDLVKAKNWSQLTSELLEFHYDPTYHNALKKFEGSRAQVKVESLRDLEQICDALLNASPGISNDQ